MGTCREMGNLQNPSPCMWKADTAAKYLLVFAQDFFFLNPYFLNLQSSTTDLVGLEHLLCGPWLSTRVLALAMSRCSLSCGGLYLADLQGRACLLVQEGLCSGCGQIFCCLQMKGGTSWAAKEVLDRQINLLLPPPAAPIQNNVNKSTSFSSCFAGKAGDLIGFSRDYGCHSKQIPAMPRI